MLLAPGSSFGAAPEDLTALLLRHPDARLRDRCHRHLPRVSAAGLSPVHLRRPPPRRVSCYALFKGWLLLSLPPRCLGRGTSFGTLSRHFGALTRVWVVPLSERELTPRPPLPPSSESGGSEFDGAGREQFPGPAQSVTLPTGQPPERPT